MTGTLNENTTKIRELLDTIYDLPADRYTEGYELGKTEGYAEGEVSGYAADTAWLAIGGAITYRYNPIATVIGDGVFSVDVTLEKIDFPAVESVGLMAFADCTALHSVNLPSLVHVGGGAFRSCEAITSLDFPRVTQIDRTAFRGCLKLETLILRAPTVCVLGAGTCLSQTLIESGTGFVYVPDDLVDQYKVATNWATYAAQIKPISELDKQ